MELKELLGAMTQHKASDLYITVDAPCMFRVDGELQPFGEKLHQSGVTAFLDSIMDNDRRKEYRACREANFAIESESGRFRVSAFFQRDLPGAVIRHIETEIPSFEDLGLPDTLKDLAMVKRGLVLVVGATGSGKSTTLAAMVGHRNQHQHGHILTVEDPIEFVHQHQQSIVTQREVGLDTESYEIALKNSLRQAPDMIVIGEIRTPETMRYAMTFAETGHLCVATLHANNANQALERILHLVSKDQREHFLLDLSLNLKGIVGQQLLKAKDGKGRHVALEILLSTPRSSDLIRQGEIAEIKNYMSKTRQEGICTFDHSLFNLVMQDKITAEEALRSADSANDLRLMLKNQQGTKGSSPLDDVKIDMG
ncbi:MULTISPECIES: PilT/PilU family type 4a pilus ATPase [Vibrio]|uniref:Twitching motility protein PilU n=1 Tax=Vibrio halioticoli NBRC 102217 TaxID=1219072 RepID=V5FG76_9VIBR|nr:MULTISPECIES: PilT/PilU family type 4a pilus ATPase [Vibrio]GAD90758.1 twitching motility protein PilU [Vibrio halioticoli NBRC 102217]